MIRLILIPLTLAWILVQNAVALLFPSRRQLIPLRPSATHVRTDVRESGLTLLPSELLYHIVEDLESESTQSSSSQGSALALSQ